jgi:RimJ/RimL family protein N-acetyltransferase
LHVEAVWDVHFASPVLNDVELSAEDSQLFWNLCVADLASGRVYIWRPGVTAIEREVLRLRADEALTSSSVGVPLSEVHREVALSLVAAPRFDKATAATIARPLTEKDQALIEAFDPGSQDYYFHPQRQPLIGVVIAGQLVSLAHSSRRTLEACELGIDTLAEARRKGYGLAATILWTQSILQEGLVPIYSADASNTASLRLADAAGYRAFAKIATLE